MPDDMDTTPPPVEKQPNTRPTNEQVEKRTREIRAVVRRGDNRHLRETITPADAADEARPTSDFHAANWKADSPPCSVTRLPPGTLPGACLTLEEVVYYCENGSAWLDILRAASKDPMSSTGYACLALVLNWRYDAHEVSTIRDQAEEATRRCGKMPSATVLAPQRASFERSRNKAAPPAIQGPPHAFLVQDVSYECAIDLAASDGMHISWDENPDGISLLYLLPDLAPPTHVGTYKNLGCLPKVTPTLRERLEAKVRAHVKSRWDPVQNFIIVNKASIWGGGKVDPWCLELVLASLRVHIWEGKTRDGKPEATLSAYFLGVFDATWLHEEWARILLGDELDLGEYGKVHRRAGADAYTCAICYFHDHHAKICPIWNHPEWPEEVRKRREQLLQQLQQQQQAQQAPPPLPQPLHFQPGAGRGYGGRGGYGRGGAPTSHRGGYGYNPGRGGGRGRGRGYNGW